MLSELSASQRELAQYMSLLSEHAYSASWMEGLEYALWRATTHGPFKYGNLELTTEHAKHLIKLSRGCDGWIAFQEDRMEVFMPLEEWKREFLLSSID